MSSEDEEENNDFEERAQGHRFAQPEEFNFNLESGAIPDAAMIHAARKRRQKAREEGKLRGRHIGSMRPTDAVI